MEIELIVSFFRLLINRPRL